MSRGASIGAIISPGSSSSRVGVTLDSVEFAASTIPESGGIIYVLEPLSSHPNDAVKYAPQKMATQCRKSRRGCFELSICHVANPKVTNQCFVRSDRTRVGRIFSIRNDDPIDICPGSKRRMSVRLGGFNSLRGSDFEVRMTVRIMPASFRWKPKDCCAAT